MFISVNRKQFIIFILFDDIISKYVKTHIPGSSRISKYHILILDIAGLFPLAQYKEVYHVDVCLW